MLLCDDMTNKDVLLSQNLIYMLHHPLSSSVYVGQTTKGLRRPQMHLSEYALKNTERQARSKWIRSMRARGLEPIITILEECVSPDDLNEAEIFWIAYFRSLEFNLLNHTEGGEGTRGFRFTEEQRQMFSERNNKRYAENPDLINQCRERMNHRYVEDPGLREKIREQGKRRAQENPEFMSTMAKKQWTPEKREARSASMSGGENISPEAREKQAAALRGKPKSAEHKAKLSEAKRRLWKDPEYRARQIAAQKKAHGTPEARAQAAVWGAMASKERSPEWCQKVSEANKKSCGTPEARQRRSEITTSLWQDDEYRAKTIDAMTNGKPRGRRARERSETDRC